MKGIHISLKVDDNGMTTRVIDQTILKRNIAESRP